MWCCKGELGNGIYILTSQLLTTPNPNTDQMDTEGAAEDGHSKMEIASVESKTATSKRKREDNPIALIKQKHLVVLKGVMTVKSWKMLNCHRKDQQRARRSAFQKEDYETLERNFPTFHQSRIDLESQNEKTTLTRNVTGEFAAIEGKDEDIINYTHKRLLLNQQV